MGLSNDLITELVRVTKKNNSNNNSKSSSNKTMMGTIVEYDGSNYVQIDGSELLTPYTSTTDVQNGDRVTVTIEDHSAIVTGNTTSPAARTDTVKELGTQISEFEIVVADKVSTSELEAESARIDKLVADTVTINEKLTATEAEIGKLQAEDVVITGKLTANEADIENLKVNKLDVEIADIKYATIEDLAVTNANINNLDATYATIEMLEANYATIDQLNANKARIDKLEVNSLTANSAEITKLQTDVADINTLIFGSASGDVISTEFSNAVVAQIGDAQIDSAMIKSLTASKITAGDISTNNVRVLSDDGSLVIADETIQISDENRVRVQIGKDAANDYSINIWDANGKLMFSEGGLTDSAIKEAIIRDDMVSDTANISAGKINIDSLFEEINGSTNTIKSTQIYLDDEEQTLNVAFKEMSSTVTKTTTTANSALSKAESAQSGLDEAEKDLAQAQEDVKAAQEAADAAQAAANQNGNEIVTVKETVSSMGTELTVIQGKINSKIWQEDITASVTGLESEIDELEKKTESMSTQYSEMNQEIDTISATVASHTTQIADKADGAEVTTVKNKVSEIELSLSGFKSTVEETYATKTEVTDINGDVQTINEQVNKNKTAIEQNATNISLVTEKANDNAEAIAQLELNAEGITSTVTKVESTVNDLEIGGKNLIRNSNNLIFEDYYFITDLITKQLVERTVTGYYYNDTLTTLGSFALYSATKITTLDMPSVIELGVNACQYCRGLKSVEMYSLTTIGNFGFSGCNNLTSLYLPSAITIGENAFDGCSKLTSVTIPIAETVNTKAFNGCGVLSELNLPSAVNIGSNTFYQCYKLTKIDMHAAMSIGNTAFMYCYSLTTVIIRTSEMCTISSNIFTNCYHFSGTVDATYNPNGNKDAYIYVPKSLIDTYKAAEYWSSYSSQFRAIEDYPGICGG